MNRLFLYVLFTLCLICKVQYASAQLNGCTDPNATNYNAQAGGNDGSCVYPSTSYQPAFLADLPTQVRETSGLIFWDGALWTINDSGNPARLYKIDSGTGTVLQSYPLKGVTNTDWEAITQSDSFIFIGDFGNNLGNRQDLRIIKIAKSELLQSTADSIENEVIHFHYPEQQSFASSNRNTPWDAEAFFWHKDSLHIFTKDWVREETMHYTVPGIQGNYAAQRKESFRSEGLITDVSRNPENGHIILLGYTKTYLAFAWLLFDYPGDRFFSGNKRRLSLPATISIGQVEGICFTGPYSGRISGEAIVSNSLGINVAPKLHAFDFEPYFTPTASTSIPGTKRAPEFRAYPSPAHDAIKITAPADMEVFIYNSTGALSWTKSIKKGTYTVPCTTWPKGMYSIHARGYPAIKISIK